MAPKSIIHVDMDAFFAAVEELDHPEYRGKPVIVGADPKGGAGRGVVAACNYEARKFGVHSALPITRAYRLCPHGVYVKPRGQRYREVSRQIFEIFHRYTDLVEGLSIDEAFLDVTGSARLFGDAAGIGRRIKADIAGELGLVASVGIAPTKFVAKIASDIDKPDGFVVVAEEEVTRFLTPLPIKRLWGVGEKTAQVLSRRGVRTIGDVAKLGETEMKLILGDHGEHLLNLARGIDPREVVVGVEAKSIGNEVTFGQDTADRKNIEGTLLALSDKVAGRLRKHGVMAAGLTLKFRDEHFRTVTRSAPFEEPTDVTSHLYRMALELLGRTGWHGERSVRLIGVTAHKLTEKGRAQRGLFDDEAGKAKLRDAELAIDRIRGKYGGNLLKRGAVLRGKEPKE